MEKLITVSGVTGYIDENGVAQLKLENVARGLGFTQTAASGNEVVRWERVNKYLEEFGFIPTSGDAGFIPENIFYRLAFKAKNETAERFQAKVADEILPAIRKTGTYSAHPMTEIEMIAAMAQHQVELEHKTQAALDSAERANKQINNALEVFAAPPDKDWRQGMNSRVRGICQQYGLSFMAFYGDLYKELEDVAGVDLDSRLRNLRKRLLDNGKTKSYCNGITKLETVEQDAKLRPIFEGIVRKYQSKYQIGSES